MLMEPFILFDASLVSFNSFPIGVLVRTGGAMVAGVFLLFSCLILSGLLLEFL